MTGRPWLPTTARPWWLKVRNTIEACESCRAMPVWISAYRAAIYRATVEHASGCPRRDLVTIEATVNHHGVILSFEWLP